MIYYKEVLSAIAIALTFIAFVPYIRAILRGAIKPHVFTWIIWGTTTFIVFLAQLEDGAGVGAWPTAVSASITIVIACLAWVHRADLSITRSDWVFFLSAMSSLPLWYFTSDPVWAVIILTTVDMLGFGPTVMKAYRLPHSESVPFYALFMVRNVLVIMALENYSVTTVLFPSAIALACCGLVTMILYRRRLRAA